MQVNVLFLSTKTKTFIELYLRKQFFVIVVLTPLVELNAQMGFLIRQFWPIDIFIVEKREQYNQKARPA